MAFFSYREIESEVIRWAEARKIIPRSTPIAQARKTAEEATELVEAAAKLQACKDIAAMAPELAELPMFRAYRAQAMAEFKDAAGDIVVVLINTCALADVDLLDCLAGSYEVIKDRKGELLPNGYFQKA